MTMILCWLISLKINNYAIVDFCWSFNFFLISLYIFMFSFERNLPQILFLGMVSLWSLRLAIYLFFARVYQKEEEGRYKTLREKWKSNQALKFLGFFLLQAITNVILSITFLFVLEVKPILSWNQIIAIVLFFIAFFGETISDLQLYIYKKDPRNSNKVLQSGLWKYSRHPNYFFEILIWFSYGLYLFHTKYEYLSFFSFLIIIFFILKVTGIPVTEEQNISSKGKEYLEYIHNTSPLIPLPQFIYKKLKGRNND